MEVLAVLFLLVIAGAIAAVVLILKLVVRRLKGPQPVDPNAPAAPAKSNNVLLVLLVVGGLLGAVPILAVSCETSSYDFLDARPVRDIPALAGRSLSAMHGVSCKSVCTISRDYDDITYCAVATLETKPQLACRLRLSGGFLRPSEPGHSFEVLVDQPAGTAPLPAKGPVALEVCQVAGCLPEKPAGEVIEACSVYPYRPDPAEPFLVCSYRKNYDAGFQ